ncbi:MAG: energy-coupling factor transporter ATPase [Bacillota bacterium]|nr:energy-coupling factor transporter ATPase [Bacillota bacterium]
MDTLIQMKNVSFSYDSAPNKLVLRDINLEVKQGEYICILGANGSGKSTLAKQLNALLLPTAGEVLVAGLDSKDVYNTWQIRSKVGMVFQNPDNQIVAAIVEEDVAFGLENIGIPSEEIKERVDWALKLVNMDKYRDRGPHFLSGGQKQRVAIAGIMAMKPACLVLDEPTAMLDPQGRKEVLETVNRLNSDEKIAVVLITHNMEEALAANRVMVMQEGQLIAEGSPRETFLQEEIIRGAGLDVPIMLELANQLRHQGIEIAKSVMTLEEMVEAL